MCKFQCDWNCHFTAVLVASSLTTYSQYLLLLCSQIPAPECIPLPISLLWRAQPLLHQFVCEGTQIRVADSYYAIHLSSSVGTSLTPAKVTTRTLLALRAESGLLSGCKNIQFYKEGQLWMQLSAKSLSLCKGWGPSQDIMEQKLGDQSRLTKGCQTQCDHSIHDRDATRDKKKKMGGILWSFCCARVQGHCNSTNCGRWCYRSSCSLSLPVQKITYLVDTL